MYKYVSSRIRDTTMKTPNPLPPWLTPFTAKTSLISNFAHNLYMYSCRSPKYPKITLDRLVRIWCFRLAQMRPYLWLMLSVVVSVAVVMVKCQGLLGIILTESGNNHTHQCGVGSDGFKLSHKSALYSSVAKSLSKSPQSLRKYFYRQIHFTSR